MYAAPAFVASPPAQVVRPAHPVLLHHATVPMPAAYMHAPQQVQVVQPAMRVMAPMVMQVSPPIAPATKAMAPPALEEVQEGRQILCYGDSNTAGFPLPLKPYGKFLEEELRRAGYPCNITVHGNSGATAKDLLAKKDVPAIPDVTNTNHPGLACLMRQKKWDLAIIMLGTNDIGAMDHTNNTFKYVKKLHELCHSYGVRTIALGAVTLSTMKDMWGLKPKRDGLSDLLNCYAAEDDENPMEELVLAYEDPKRMVPRGDGNWNQDDLHITEKGQALLAKQLLPVVVTCLDKLTAIEEANGLSQ